MLFKRGDRVKVIGYNLASFEEGRNYVQDEGLKIGDVVTVNETGSFKKEQIIMIDECIYGYWLASANFKLAPEFEKHIMKNYNV